jgi:hypothetical protein
VRKSIDTLLALTEELVALMAMQLQILRYDYPFGRVNHKEFEKNINGVIKGYKPEENIYLHNLNCLTKNQKGIEK